MNPYDATFPDQNTPTADPTAIDLPPRTSIDITAYLPAVDSEPTA